MPGRIEQVVRPNLPQSSHGTKSPKRSPGNTSMESSSGIPIDRKSSLPTHTRNKLILIALVVLVGTSAIIALLKRDDSSAVFYSIVATLCGTILAVFHFLGDRRFRVFRVVVFLVPLLIGCTGYVLRTSEIARGHEQLRNDGIPFVGGIDRYFDLLPGA